MNYQSILTTDWGQVIIRADEEGILSVGATESRFDEVENENEWSKKGKQQLKEYFEGTRTEFELPLKFCGSEFQIKVWKALLTIPYGTCVSYKDICHKIGNKKAYQAVGTAVGRNPFFVIVPCHRVISSDGTIGGYALGLEMKRRLFTLERILEKGKGKSDEH